METTNIGELEISVIIPAYNAEKYIEHCIKSVCNQSVKNIEIIVVDDGSKDKTLSICQKYSEQDSRVLVIHQENKGVSAARNKALDCARGVFVFFLDADDWIPKNALETLLSISNPQENGLYLGGIRVISASGNWAIESQDSEVYQINHKKWAETIFNYKGSLGYIASKLLINRIIQENKLRFNENIKYSEDACFVYRYMYYCDLIRTTSILVYNYNRKNEIAATSKYNSDQVFNKLNFLKEQVYLVQKELDNMEVARIVSKGLLWQIKDISSYHVYYATQGPDEAKVIEACSAIYSFMQERGIGSEEIFSKDVIGKYFITKDFGSIYSYYYELYLARKKNNSILRRIYRRLHSYIYK